MPGILADFALLSVEDTNFYLTHGHLHGEHNPPPLKQGDFLFNGHTHTPRQVTLPNGAIYCNCGSVSLPKEGTPHSYVLFDGEKLTWYNLQTGEPFTPSF